MKRRIARNTEISRNFLGRPPVSNFVDVCKSHRIADFTGRLRTIGNRLRLITFGDRLRLNTIGIHFLIKL